MSLVLPTLITQYRQQTLSACHWPPLGGCIYGHIEQQGSQGNSTGDFLSLLETQSYYIFFIPSLSQLSSQDFFPCMCPSNAQKTFFKDFGENFFERLNSYIWSLSRFLLKSNNKSPNRFLRRCLFEKTRCLFSSSSCLFKFLFMLSFIKAFTNWTCAGIRLPSYSFDMFSLTSFCFIF